MPLSACVLTPIDRRRFLRPRSRSSRLARVGHLRQEHWVRQKSFCSGTSTNADFLEPSCRNGGSNGATMRFAPEANHGANAGLEHARNHLEPIKKKFPQITYSDLWVNSLALRCCAKPRRLIPTPFSQTLAGVCAVQELGGPYIPWRAGRKDGYVEFRFSRSQDGRFFFTPPLLHVAATSRTAPRTAACRMATRAQTTFARSSTAWASTTTRSSLFRVLTRSEGATLTARALTDRGRCVLLGFSLSSSTDRLSSHDCAFSPAVRADDLLVSNGAFADLRRIAPLTPSLSQERVLPPSV